MPRSPWLEESIEGDPKTERTFHKRNKEKRKRVMKLVEETPIVFDKQQNRPQKDYVALIAYKFLAQNVGVRATISTPLVTMLEHNQRFTIKGPK